MTAYGSCVESGTINLQFDQADVDFMSSWLDEANTPLPGSSRTGAGANGYTRSDAILEGESLDPSADPPLLCRDIVGNVEAQDAAGDPLPNSGSLVSLDSVDGYEVSGHCGGQPDVTAYVYGVAGNNDLTIYITDISAACGDSP